MKSNIIHALCRTLLASGKGSATVDGSAFENSRIKLTVNSDGAISSFIDKAHSALELAATIDGLEMNDFAANDASGSAVVVENSGPLSVTLKCVSDAGVPHRTRVTLFRDSDRVEISNEIAKNFAGVRHWAFTFALSEPAVRTEEVGAIVLHKLKSAGGDYADTHARYDYLTVRHFADISDGADQKGVTLSNADLAFAKLAYSTPGWLDTATPQLHLLAGGQVDGAGLGIRAQNENTHFLQRFALRAHGGYDQTAAMKFALEHQNPFVTGAIVSKDGGAYPETTYSLLTVSNTDVLLWALKVHDDGPTHGLVARLWNLSDAAAKADLALFSGLSAAQRTTHIETDVEAIPLTGAGALPAVFTPQQIQTYRLQIK